MLEKEKIITKHEKCPEKLTAEFFMSFFFGEKKRKAQQQFCALFYSFFLREKMPLRIDEKEAINYLTLRQQQRGEKKLNINFIFIAFLPFALSQLRFA